MALRINMPRISSVGEALSALGPEGVEALEEGDPQYGAVEHLVRALGDCGSAALLVVLNALVSYQLSSRGEEYWWEFARHPFAPGPPEDLVARFKMFLRSSRGNVAAEEAKISRISRIQSSQAHVEIYARALELGEDLEKLRRILARALGKKGDEKTIVFAVKMFYYTLKACGSKARIPASIEIPVDRRVAAVTYTSGIADPGPGDPVAQIMRRYREAQRAWSEVSRISGIPMLSLDTILWLCGKHARDEKGAERAYLELARYSRGRVSPGILRRVASELLARRLPQPGLTVS